MPKNRLNPNKSAEARERNMNWISWLTAPESEPYWDVLSHLVTAVVAISVFGESISHIVPILWLPVSIRDSERLASIAKWSTWALILALAFELPIGMAKDAISARAFADLNGELKVANKSAKAAEHKVDELKHRLAPRDLTEEQKQRLVAAIYPFKEQKYDVAIEPGADDGLSLWETLYPALKDAGWEYVLPGQNALTTGDPPDGIPVPSVAVPGIRILFDQHKRKELEPAVLALGNTLLRFGLKIRADQTAYENRNEDQQNTISITIGVRAPP